MKYLEAKSDQGYKIHAVPATADRVGLFDIFTWGRPICGTLKGRTSGLMPNMRVGKDPIPFAEGAFRNGSRVCAACLKEAAKQEPTP